MKFSKFFVGFFAVAAAMLTTSCLSSEEEGGASEAPVTPGVVNNLPTTNGGSVAQVTASAITTPTEVISTSNGAAATATITPAIAALVSDDATVTFSVDKTATNAVVVSLNSSDESTAAIPGGLEVEVSGLEPNSTYTTADGTPVTVDANGVAKVTIKNYGTPIILTKVQSPVHSGGNGGN